MKTLLFSVLLTILLQDEVAGQLSGRLTNEAGQPIAAANIMLLRSIDTSLVNAVISDSSGAYHIEQNEIGKYFLQISSVGYSTWSSGELEFSSSQVKVDLGTQALKTNSKALGEVVVRSSRPLLQQNAYGTTVNVESSLLTKGSSVLQVLERSPGVIIDHRNNDISLNGKSGVTVMLNGKVMRMSMAQVLQLLNGMSADDIATIELLTTPPSGYDAEGSAGLINIVVKKNRRRGTNGSLSLTGGYGVGEKGTGNINLSHNTKKIQLNVAYAFSHNRGYSDMYITSSQNMPSLGGPLFVQVWNTTNTIQRNHDARMGMDVNLDSTTVAGGNISWNSSTASSTTLSRLDYKVLPDSLLLFNGTIKGVNHWRNLVSSFFIEKQLSKNDRINANVDYIYFTNNNPSAINSSFFNKNGEMAGTNNDTLYSPLQNGFANTAIRVTVGKIDYLKQLNNKVKLESGIKGTYTNVASTSGIQSLVNNVWQNRSESFNGLRMNEWIGAIYASLNATLSPSLNFVAGARYEYAHTHLDNAKTKETTVDRSKGVLFPNIFFTKKLNDQSDLQLSFTSRISRPSYNDLASYVSYADPSAVLTGNPYLKPTITNNIKLGYNYKGYSVSLLLTRDNNPISRYQLTESKGRDLLLVSPQNLAWHKTANLQVNIPVRVNNWWNMSFGFTGGWRHYKVVHTPQPAEKSYMGYSANFSQAFKLPQGFSFELSGWYNSTWYYSASKGDGFGALNSGIKKELKNNKGSFQLSVSDLLGSISFNSYYGAVTREAFDIKNHVKFNTESAKFPIIRLAYSKSFGSATAKKTGKVTGSAEEESERIRKD
ncbi:MAG: outer membrane beta-barrel family protein [Ginsengibacter sp.]